MLMIFIGYGIYFGFTMQCVVLICFSSILFGFKLWLDHIRKPDPIPGYKKALDDIRKEFEVTLIQYKEAVNTRMEKTENKVGSLSMNLSSNPKKQQASDYKW